ncbi:MAG: TraR/DksA family transcriptional regulator [Leucobacter sp.]
MSTRDDARLHDLLMQVKEDVLERAHKLEMSLQELVGSRADANDDDEHDPEGVTLSAEWSRLSGLVRSAQMELTEVDAALARWDSGEYGVCTHCGRDIPIARLEVRPYAERCVSCAALQN